MTTMLARLGAIAAALALSACATHTDINEVRNMALKGTDFHKALHKEYIALAVKEQGESDWEEVDWFLAKARDAGSSEAPQPDYLEARNIKAKWATEAAFTRDRLINALNTGGRTRAAADTARAQAMFDCWMEEIEEDNQPAEIRRCLAEFEAAMDKVVAILKVPPPGPAAAATPAPAAAPAAAARPAAPAPAPERKFVIYFDSNSALLDIKARETLVKIAMTARSLQAKEIALSAHADRSGGAEANMKLSQARLEAVTNYLTREGFAPGLLKGTAAGEDKTVSGAKDGERAAADRRVEVEIK